MGGDDGTVEVRGLGRRMPVAEAARLLESDPSAFSAGVLLRPLSQDHLLPDRGLRRRSRGDRLPRADRPRPTRTSASRGRRWFRGPASPSSSPRRRGRWRRTSCRCPTCSPTRRACSRAGRARTTRRWMPPSTARAKALEKEMAAVEETLGRARPDPEGGRRLRARPRPPPDRDPAGEGHARAQEARPVARGPACAARATPSCPAAPSRSAASGW